MPARLLVREPTQTSERPPEELSELRDRPCWLDISDPQSTDFALAAKELNLHPLEEPSPGVVREVEISIFMLQNAIVTVHEGDFSARAAVEKRFREGKLQTTGLLLHALLDTIVDQY